MPRERLLVFRDSALDGPTNMARDEHLLYAEDVPAALRIYRWDPPTISLGYFQQVAQLQTLPEDVRGLAFVRRSTGGGAILHDREVTYCLVLGSPVGLAQQGPTVLYRLVHACWRDAIATTGPASELAPESFPLPSPRSGPFFCFEKPGRTDLLVGSDKVLGSAQRRIPGRVLQHGSLILGRRFGAHPGGNLGDPGPELVTAWTDSFVARLADALAMQVEPGTWDVRRQADVTRRRAKFASEAWNRMR